MDKQKIYTNASYEYMNEIMDLKSLASYHSINPKKVLFGYDILLQISLMHMVGLDGKVSSIETEFLELIVKENDLMKLLSERLNKNISWDILSKIDKYDEFLASVEGIFKVELSEFINLFTSLDFKTGEDYLNRLKGNIYYICQAVLEIDGFDESEKRAMSVLNETIFNKLDDIKIAIDDITK